MHRHSEVLQSVLKHTRRKRRILQITGPRQSGKTTLITHAVKTSRRRVLYLDGSRINSAGMLLRDLRAASAECLVIDNAHTHEHLPALIAVIADGGFRGSFILCGRQQPGYPVPVDALENAVSPFGFALCETTLLPLSIAELPESDNPDALDALLPNILVHGLYPAVRDDAGADYDTPRDALETLMQDYILGDIRREQRIRGEQGFLYLMRLLAYTPGTELGLRPLMRHTGLHAATLQRYIHILKGQFLIFSLPSFARNGTGELRNGEQVYFYDTGVRNAVLADFKPWKTRPDKAALWHTFLMSERKKSITARNISVSAFFWRNYHGASVDYLEEQNGSYHAFCFSPDENTSPPLPDAFKRAYPEAAYTVVNPSNWQEFVLL